MSNSPGRFVISFGRGSVVSCRNEMIIDNFSLVGDGRMSDDSADNKNILKGIIFNVTMLILIFTVFYYLVAYRFEAGMKAFYHIPDKLIEINTLTLIRPSVPFTVVMLIVVAALFVYLVLILFILFLGDKFIFSRWTSNRLIGIKDLTYGMKFIVAIVVVAVILSSYSQAYTLGMNNASNETAFWTAEIDNSLYAVVDTYNNNFIVVPINIEEFTFKSEYRFINPEDENVQFKRIVLNEALHEE